LDKKFLKYIKDKKGFTLAVIALALGLILLFLGERGDGNLPSITPDVEERLAAACSDVDGVGECVVLLNYSSDGDTVESVIVICDGAGSVEVRSRLTGMLSSFFGIGTNRIRVEQRRGDVP
jgi:hypothetical protein